MGPIEDSWTLHPRGSCSITPSSDAARRPCGSQVFCRYCWTAVAFFSGWQVKAMKRWRLTIFPGSRFSGVSCSCIGRLVPGVSQPLFFYRYRWCISAWDDLPQAGKDCSSCVMCPSLVRWNHSCGLQLSSFGPKTLLSLGGWQFFQAVDFLVWVAAALDDWYLECRNLFFYRYRWCISAWDDLPQAGKDCSSCVIYIYIYLAKSKNGENKVLTCTLPFWYEKGCARGVRCVRAGCAYGVCGVCVRGVRTVRAVWAYGARGLRARCAQESCTVRTGCVRMSERV